jgi:DNA-binding NtrC family response regulator
VVGEVEEITEKLCSVVWRLTEWKVPYKIAMEMWRREWLAAELIRANGNQCVAARRMGVHRNTVSRWQSQSGLTIKKTPKTGWNIRVEKKQSALEGVEKQGIENL